MMKGLSSLLPLGVTVQRLPVLFMAAHVGLTRDITKLKISRIMMATSYENKLLVSRKMKPSELCESLFLWDTVLRGPG